eukprot:GILI01018922.1.p1 GENE.GILI01018922.1~~GILI01018922.1.p1  ORF type:complete len:218 (+),score=27.54 GILI01018922.1:74-727(+)
MNIIDSAVTFVKDHLSSNDASHDWTHIERVRLQARTLAIAEGLSERSQEIVELAAILHDVGDYKYSGSLTAAEELIRGFLSSQNYDQDRTDQIVHIVNHMGFKEEISGMVKEITPELAVVQDADRLDAIGAIGIARCLTYGGSKKRPLYDPSRPPRENISKEEYMEGDNTTINHFYEKLLKLKDLMKTQAGRAVAQKRHEFMEQFLEQFHLECAGKA